MKALALALLLLQQTASTPLHVPDLVPPTRQSAPPTPAETPILREGIALFDQGKFDEALARFDQVLSGNPENVIAMYEKAQTLFKKNEPQKAIELAAIATQYSAPALPQLYALIGNVLDISREPQKAVEVYKKGIALNTPNAGILYLNLGVTYMGSLRDGAEAKTAFKQGMLVEPNYPGNHFQLANIYAAQGLKTATLLAFTRFLSLEPGSSRSQIAYAVWRSMLDNRSTPTFQPASPYYEYSTSSAQTGEGDLTQLDAALVTSKAAAATPGKTQIQVLVDQVDTLFDGYSTLQPGDTFLWKYYLPYAIDMKQKGHVEAFVYLVNQRTTLPGVREWLTANTDRVNAFVLWSRTYKWPDRNSVDPTR